MTRRARIVPLILTALLAAAVLAPRVPAAPGQAAEPKTELERLDRAMNRARDLIRNATVKLSNGVVSGMQQQDDATLPDTAATRCCSGNLDGLAESYRRIEASLARMQVCYRSRGIADESADMLTLAGEDLETLRRVTDNFARAGDMHTTQGSLAAMQRAFLLLKKSRDGMFEDCPLQ